MRCPECVRLGLTSRLDEKRAALVVIKGADGSHMQIGSRTVPDGTVERFWDKNDRRHVHDHEVRTFVYTCSEGHAFKQVVMSRCPCKGCDWNKQPEVKAGQEPIG